MQSVAIVLCWEAKVMLLVLEKSDGEALGGVTVDVLLGMHWGDSEVDGRDLAVG